MLASLISVITLTIRQMVWVSKTCLEEGGRGSLDWMSEEADRQSTS